MAMAEAGRQLEIILPAMHLISIGANDDRARLLRPELGMAALLAHAPEQYSVLAAAALATTIVLIGEACLLSTIFTTIDRLHARTNSTRPRG